MSKKLFVGGLSWDTSNDSLRVAFERFGPVAEAKVITDRETGRSRGFGFVTFDSPSDAQTAISDMDDTEIDGRRVRVNEAQDRRDGGGGGGGSSARPPGGGGGGGGGGFRDAARAAGGPRDGGAARAAGGPRDGGRGSDRRDGGGRSDRRDGGGRSDRRDGGGRNSNSW